ncbi:Aldehyde dehydrogenase PuuC [Rothia kristinae]|nr:Aldehyde dehydrogenase PuuC [Rothia kristinae]
MTESIEQIQQQARPADLPEVLRHYIGGEFVDSLDGETFDVLDPVTNRPYIRAASGKKADVDAAVAAAKEAFEHGPWPGMLPRERSRVLHRIADIVESRGEALAAMESYDSGLPITQALGQARRAAENFRFFADLIVAQHDDAFKVPGRQVNYVNRKPKGVAGLITPWNTPFMLESWKLAPAIATGNTVVLKPAEFTPLSASLWPGIFEEAGLPVGVFNLVNGFGEEGYAGDSLVKHPDVPLISFTGESRTGQIIFANAAPHLKGLSMELGGKSPAVVFEDADLDTAIDATIFGVFSLNGERCTAGSRILVQRGIYDEFVSRYAAQAERVRWACPRRRPRRSGRWCIRSTSRRSCPMFRSAGPRPGWWPAADARSSSRRATSSGPRSSPTSPPRPGSSRRRSSGRSWPSPPSTPRRRRWPWPMTRSTGWPPTSGPTI